MNNVAKSLAALSLAETAGFATSMFLIGSFFLALSPILPDVAMNFEVDPKQLGLPSGAYGFTLALVSIALAPAQDMFPRGAMLIAGTLLHFFGLVCVALAPAWSAIVIGHAICGTGAGIYMLAAYAAVSERGCDASKAKILGRVNIGWAASTLVGVPIAAHLGDMLGWRAAMLALSAIWVLVTVLTSSILRRESRRTGTGFKNVGIWPGDVLRAMRRHRLHWLFASTILVFVGFYGVYAFLGLAVRDGLDVDAGGAGVFISLYGGGFLLGSLNGWTIDRLGAARGLAITTAVLAVVLAVIPQFTASVAILGIAMFIWGVFQNAAFTSIATFLGGVESAIRGRAFSIHTACVFLGSSIGTVTMGVVNSEQGFEVVGLVCMIVTFSAALIAAVGLRRAR